MINDSSTMACSEHESKKLLKRYNIPVVNEFLVSTDDDAAKVSEQLGFPVVIKGSGTSLTHKTELGLVHVSVQDKDGVRHACRSIAGKAGNDLEGFLVQPHVHGKREFVAGMFRDPYFGPVIMFGLGGVFTEALSDVIFRIAPLTEGDAEEMINEIRSKALLEDFRGERAVDRRPLVRTLTALSRIALEHTDIREIDINPLLITSEGPPPNTPGRHRCSGPILADGLASA